MTNNIENLDTQSAYDMFYKYKYLIVNLLLLFFFHLGFWNENFILIAPFSDHYLLVPYNFHLVYWYLHVTSIEPFEPKLLLSRHAYKMEV